MCPRAPGKERDSRVVKATHIGTCRQRADCFPARPSAVSWQSAGPDVTVVVPASEKKKSAVTGNGSFEKRKRQETLPSWAQKYCFFCSRETSKRTDVFAFSQRLSHGTTSQASCEGLVIFFYLHLLCKNVLNALAHIQLTNKNVLHTKYIRDYHSKKIAGPIPRID